MKKQIVYLVTLAIGSSFSVNAQVKGMGLKKDNAGYAKTALISKPLGFGANLPKSMSLKQYCPNIGDQGQTGTCTAWSSTYYAASMEYAILNNITNSNDVTNLAFDPYYTYLNILSEEEESKKTCEDGTYIGDACELLVQYGAKRKAFDPFDCQSKESAVSNKESACPIDFTNYVRLSTQDWEGEQQDEFDVMITSICQTLVNKHPVIIGMELLESFYNIGADGKYDAANGGQESVGGHAMCVVGYDDNKFGGSFMVVNSWADGWGEKGFLYVTYKDFYKYVWYTFALESEMKSFDMTGCVGGDCEAGYGMMIYNTKKMHGTAEGIFSEGKMISGIYTNLTGSISSKEIKMMEKFVKSNDGAELIYQNGTPIGYVYPY